MLCLSLSEKTGGASNWGKIHLKCKVDSECFIPYRAEKQMINEKIKEGDQPEEVDDSGFYAGKKIVP